MVQKIFSKVHPVSCTNTHEVTDLVNHSGVNNTKTETSRERSITFPKNKKFLTVLYIAYFENRSFCSEGNF